MNRRGFLAGIIGLCAAPAIVRAGSLMPVKVPSLVIPRNRFLTPDEITREMMKILHQKTRFLDDIARQYDESFAQIGNSLRIRLPNSYAVTAS